MMILNEKPYDRKCPKCGAFASKRRNNGFCRKCREFFTEKIGNRWFDETDLSNEFSYADGFTYPR